MFSLCIDYRSLTGKKFINNDATAISLLNIVGLNSQTEHFRSWEFGDLNPFVLPSLRP